MRNRILVMSLPLVVLACSDPQIPDRSISYEFRNAGEIFRWPTERLPVRYWAEDVGSLRSYVAAAILTWENQFLYREWTGVMTSDSSEADVVVLIPGGAPPAATLTNDPPVTSACGGVTAFATVGNVLEGPIPVTLTWSTSSTPTDIANCLARVTTHEIGHTLGLLDHSPDVDDLMFRFPSVRIPSRADKNTVQILYHTPPTLQPPSR